MKNSKILILAIAAVFISFSCEKNNDEFGEGVTFTEIVDDSTNPLTLGDHLVDYAEIIGYDSSMHMFSLTDEAGERIRSQHYPVTPTPFAVAVDGELIYIAHFVPGYSSIAFYEGIRVDPFSYNNKYVMELGYPTSDLYSGTDPRNDDRIISRLEKDDKLIEGEGS